MARRAATRASGKRKRQPKKRNATSFVPGTNAVNGAAHHRGPDLVPRKPVVAMAIENILFRDQLRNPRTGRLSQSKWAVGVPGAGMRDYIAAGMRSLYELAHGSMQEGATGVAGVTRFGEFIGAYLDGDKPTGPRVTIFNVAPGAPNAEIPPEQGRRPLTQAEGGYVEIREEEARS